MNNEKIYNNLEELLKESNQEIKTLYTKYRYLELTEQKFILLCEDLLVEIFSENNNLTLTQYMYLLTTAFNHYLIIKYIDNEINKDNTMPETIKYITELKKIAKFLEIHNIELSPELSEKLLDNNDIIILLANIVNNNLIKIKEEGLNRIINDKNIILLLEMYCEKHNILYNDNLNEMLSYDFAIADNRTLDSLGLYLKQISKTLLTKEEEKRLFERKERGDTKAITEIAEHNLLLVVHIANKYVGQGLDILDLIQEGNIGLMTAINKFDYRKGYKLSTYATWWIKQSIQRSIMNNSKLIRVPVHVFEKINKCAEVTNDLSKELSRTPTKQEIRSAMNMTQEQFAEIERASQSVISMNVLLGDEYEADTELGDLIPSDDEPLDEQVFNSMMSEEILHILDRIDITERERFVLLERSGFNDNKPKTLEEIAGKLGLTRERVRQIEAKTLRKIRRSPYLKKLASLSKDYSETNQFVRNHTKTKTRNS